MIRRLNFVRKFASSHFFLCALTSDIGSKTTSRQSSSMSVARTTTMDTLVASGRLIRASMLKQASSYDVDRSVSILSHIETFRTDKTASKSLLLYLRECMSAVLSAPLDAKSTQLVYRYVFMIDDMLTAAGAISLRALSSGVKKGSHVLINATSYADSDALLTDARAVIDAKEPSVIVVHGASPDDIVEVHVAAALLRKNCEDVQTVSYLGGTSEMATLASIDKRFAV